MSKEEDGYLYFKLWVGAHHPRSKKPFELGVDVIGKVLDEAKADFPKKIFFDHPNPDNPEEPANDAEEFYDWFKKWFGPITLLNAKDLSERPQP